MKTLLRSALATLSLALTTASFAADSDPGYIDIGQFLPADQGQFVEVNLSPGLIKFAARLAKHQEPEAAELLGSLKRIRVNVIGLDDTNRAGTVDKIEAVRRQLEAQGWTKMVTVRENNGGDNVDVHVKQPSEDVIQGLVVTVIDKKGEAVFVNIVGNIKADQLGELAEKFNIEPLRKAKVRISKN